LTLQKHAQGEGFPDHPDDEPEPAPPWSEGYLEGLALFNARHFWECHEALEAIWLPLSAGPKLFYQAIIQTAAAFHHVTVTGRWNGARKLFEEARKKLWRYSESREWYGGIDVRDLTRRVTELRDIAAAIEEGRRPADSFPADGFFELWPEP
jgi:predicted metal-dependent hydrolase